MAIDGTKIIDSDLAHDIDDEFMELYDSGKSIDEIKEKMEQWRSELFYDYEEEIFITTYALDLWKVGALTEDILNEAKETIAKGVGVAMWREESGDKDAEARDRELKKLIEKISVPNKRPQAIKKYKKIEDLFFQLDDVLTFKASDGCYYATIFVSLTQGKGRTTYHFAPMAYKGLEKPNLSDLLKSHIIGRKKPLGGIEHVGIDHNDLSNFVDKFEVVGKIKIKENSRGMSLYSGALDFESFSKMFVEQGEHLAMPVWEAEKIPVTKLLEKRGLGRIKSWFF